MLTDLADIVTASGLAVTETKGWKNRGYRGWTLDAVAGGVVHHTATPSRLPGDLPTGAVLTDGRSDLPGPLCQLAIGRSGRVYIIAAGYANHAGPVNDRNYSNARSIGIECEHPGDSTRWPPAQYAALVTLCAHLGRHYGIKWRGHKEVAIPLGRKIDPTLDMGKLRADIGKDGKRPAEPAKPKPEPAGPHTHLIKSGDTLGSIAGKYSTTVGALVILNGISDPDKIRAGEHLYVRWNVKAGQTLSAIAKVMRTTVAAIAKANGISDPDKIRAGAWLRIP